MLIRYSVENFRSIRDRQELSLVASALKDLPNALIRVEDFSQSLLPVVAIYGANASGKTNLLKALRFVCDSVRDSQRLWAPANQIERPPFRMDEFRSRASAFEVDFLVSGSRFRYSFSLNDEEILSESLQAFPQGKSQLWYERENGKFTFGRSLYGENRTIESLTRRNSLFLSAAAQNNHVLLTPIFDWFCEQDFVLGGRSVSPNDRVVSLCKDDSHRDLLLKLLAAADLGVTGYRVEESEWPDEAKKIFDHVKQLLPSAVKMPDKLATLMLVHGAGENEAVFPITEESSGTSALLKIIGPAIKSLEHGSVLCVDELDASLHPLLALHLVKMFNDSETNPKGAQLVFNTHDTNLLDNDVLRRDQVWFTEKDRRGATHLYPLSDFRPRRNENLERGYLQGRFGAIPFLGTAKFHPLGSSEDNE
ncbi:conserved hypothetical protein [Candidatus Koribacter versatilis Ellin345]|uniref:ATPase AAA-type core domain-containing protein n=1 Tax=Koribacter versatilis (strain Ellin345) TaxID=204669 RepID=Q1IPY5_KORVE|nr:conserved hypothetical protein [Candidatus Koribacter versatilis Ellin345]